MSVFEDFQREFGPAEDCLSPGDEAIEAWRGKLPDELLELWRETGWCSYGNGLLRVTDPAQLSDVLEDWVDAVEGEPLVFLRTSFAHLYFWCDGWVYSLDVQHGSLSQVTEDIARIFTLICNPRVKEKILRESLHEQAAARLGRPARDECFAFEPALALGGSGDVETISRVRIREHLAILAQIAG